MNGVRSNMKLKIISDGTNVGTRLIDENTGEMIGYIQKITWKANVESFLPTVTVELLDIPVEIVTKSECQSLKFNGQLDPDIINRDIKIISNRCNEHCVTTTDISICDNKTGEEISGIQSIEWEATPSYIKSKMTYFDFENESLVEKSESTIEPIDRREFGDVLTEIYK
jgi:hypothetical protein